MEFYTKALPFQLAMWVKMVGKTTLGEIFDEAIKVEKDISSLGENPGSGENKDQPPPMKNNKEIKLNKEGKEKETTKIKSLHRMLKELTNTMIDLNRNTRESLRKPSSPRRGILIIRDLWLLKMLKA